jgi:hypothetical protein
MLLVRRKDFINNSLFGAETVDLKKCGPSETRQNLVDYSTKHKVPNPQVSTGESVWPGFHQNWGGQTAIWPVQGGARSPYADATGHPGGPGSERVPGHGLLPGTVPGAVGVGTGAGQTAAVDDEDSS